MNFKSIGLCLSVTTAVVASSAVTSLPAQAGTFKVSANGLVENVSGVGVDFVNTVNPFTADRGAGSTGRFDDFFGGTFQLADLKASTIGDTLLTLVNGSNTLKFTLLGFDPGFVSFTSNGVVTNAFTAKLQGVFSPGGTQAASDSILFSAQVKNNQGVEILDTTEITLTEVPTPALLPGLIGIGVAAWRKRKGQAAEQANA